MQSVLAPVPGIHSTDDVDLEVRAADPEPAPDILEEWGMQSFPASDPPANW